MLDGCRFLHGEWHPGLSQSTRRRAAAFLVCFFAFCFTKEGKTERKWLVFVVFRQLFHVRRRFWIPHLCLLGRFLFQGPQADDSPRLRLLCREPETLLGAFAARLALLRCGETQRGAPGVGQAGEDGICAITAKPNENHYQDPQRYAFWGRFLGR